VKVLLVGSGCREHALAKLVLRSTQGPRLYVASDHVNPGLLREAESSGGRLFVVNTTDPQRVARVAKEVSPDLVVVGPEEPQFAGVVDVLRDGGYAVFGASSRCSLIERSKVFARTLMWKYGIPGRLYFRAFRSLEEASEFLRFAGDVVIKPARQAGGKGVRVIRDTRAYLATDKSEVKAQAASRIYEEVSRYNDIEYRVIVEQRVEGVEYTAQVVTDGSYVLPLPLVQDHPHAFEGDLGPETGGMGSVSGPGVTLPFITYDEYRTTVDIVRQVLEKLQVEVGDRYVGAFAGQMMLTALWGPTVIEFYSRFGDPEIANLLPRLNGDFLDVVERAVGGRLAGAKIPVREEVVSVVKAVAPAGYPSSKEEASGHPVAVDEARIRELGCELLYASVVVGGDGHLYTKGSRAFEIVCSADSYPEAYRLSELALGCVRSLDGWPLFYRSDIGSPELIEERVRVAERVRRVYTHRASQGLSWRTVVWVPGRGVVEDPLLSYSGWSR
jgi:phosphoribosylamine--glycine ligase